MSAVTHPDYVRPQPQPELNNDEGLTSQQIAIALRADHANVKRAIRNVQEKLPSFHLERRKFQVPGKVGRPDSVYVLPTREAKMVVAKYDNEAGFGYLTYLLDLEAFAIAEIPRLRAELMRYKEREERRSLPKTARALVFVYDENLFGERYVVKKVWVDEKDAGQYQVWEGKRWLCIRSAEGLLAKARKLEEQMNTPLHAAKSA